MLGDLICYSKARKENIMEILRVEDLVKTYGKGENQVNAVDHISFSIDKGEFVAIVELVEAENLRYYIC